MAAFARDLAVEYDLQQQIAEFVAQVRQIAAFDRIHEFIGLLDRVARECRKGLLAIPWAAVGRTQTCHDGEQLLQSGTHCACSCAQCFSTRRRNVISMPAVAPQILREPYGMSKVSSVSSPIRRWRGR